MKSSLVFQFLAVIWTILVVPFTHIHAFVASPSFTQPTTPTTARPAGGFEWDNDQHLDQDGVENPFKNPQLMTEQQTLNTKIDPARLLSPRLNGSNLYLVGMMGAGKSAVGRILAKRMGTYKFLDTDDIIETAAGLSIPEIFESDGETSFRTLESQVLSMVHPYVRCVVSTGGGIVTQVENWAKLHTGLVIWLDVSAEVIMERIAGTDRPLLQTPDPLQTLKDLLDERLEQYNNADLKITVTADMTESDVADVVVKELHDFLDDNPPAWKLAKQKAQQEGLDWVQ